MGMHYRCLSSLSLPGDIVHQICMSIALAFLVLARPLCAQLAEVQPGVRVRISAPGIVAGHYVGTVLTRSADTLRVGAPTSAPITVPVYRLSSLEVSRGNSRALGAARGMLWGAPIGLGLGLVLIDSPGGGQNAAAGLLAGLMWGAGIGAIVGRERWESYDLAPHTSVDVGTGRPQLGLSLSF
jgi:hypothetical protein